MVIVMKDVNALIESFPEGSAEREYHGAIAEIIRRIEFDDSNAQAGIGLLNFLTDKSFIAGMLDTRVHPVAGSRIENAILVSYLFSSLGRDVDWWVAESLKGPTRWDEWWLHEFQKSSDVDQVFE